MFEEICTNEVYVSGKVVRDPTYDHTYKDGEFYKFYISVTRFSGVQDVLPVIMLKERINFDEVKAGNILNIQGEYRSFNDNGKLILFIFAKRITLCDEDAMNNFVMLEGYVCKRGDVRTTPKGRSILDVILAVNRSHNNSSYIPLVVWSPEMKAKELKVGDKVIVSGRIQSRVYYKLLEDETLESRIAYEVSVFKVK
jgi:single-stranded DNA-binding protein